MYRRDFIRNTGLVFTGMTIAQQKLLAGIKADPWNIKMLTKEIGVFTEKGGTILFYLGSQGTVVVDTEFPEQAKHLITELQKKSDKGFSLLINTHHHGDHTSGNISFKGKLHRIAAHENSLKNQKRFAESQNTQDKQLYPTETYMEKWSTPASKEKISMHYFGPAHTDGDSLVHFENANIVHMGDLINNRRYPYIDRTAGASIKNWIVVLDKAVTTFDKNTVYVFGHASPGFEVYGKKEDILASKDYFEKLLKFTESAVRSGISKEEFLKNKNIPGVTEWVGDGIERSLTAAYEEVSE